MSRPQLKRPYLARPNPTLVTCFQSLLRDRQTDPIQRRWLYVPYDQLSSSIGPLSREDPRDLGILLVENRWKARQRPYHKQKLALIIANLRHFALEQAARGVAIRHVAMDAPYHTAIVDAAKTLGPLRMMRAAERELRVDLEVAVAAGALEVIPHEGWLTTTEQFRLSHPKGAPWLMEKFYRYIRRETGILMNGREPEGGAFNFDAENRSPYKDGPAPPALPTFPLDVIKQEVGELIQRHYAQHPGTLNLENLPATAADAEQHWQWAQERCLPLFGKYEDAMSTRSSNLFHSRVSALVNIHRLLPARIVRDVSLLDIPIASKEGFIRQVLGWREFMRHVHEETDGFRSLPHANVLHANNSLPPAFWGEPSGLNCLDNVVKDVWREGYSHHITRLMILSNLATLLDVSPRELTDWFWVAYVDAYDWVVEPNVLGMGTFSLGPVFTTKPYVSGSNYIHRMSDYCEACQYDPKTTCPFPSLYWAFLARHADVLEKNPRISLLYRSLAKRPAEQQRADERTFQTVKAALKI